MKPAFLDQYIQDVEDTIVLTVIAFDRIFEFHYPKYLDDIDVIGVDHDGEVFVASCGQRPVYDSGAWYMGDERVQAGLIKIKEKDAPQLMTYLELNEGVYIPAQMPEGFTPTLGDIE